MKLVATAGMTLVSLFGGCQGSPGPDASPQVCHEEQAVCGRPLQAEADAAWEGLDMEEQQELLATGETGHRLDELVINYRKGN